MTARADYLFAKLGLQLVHHRKCVKAGEAAMGVYAFLVMYSRLEELDGAIPFDVAERCWTGDRRANRQRLAKLVEVGLVEVDGDDVRVVHYAQFNETKSQIEARRAKDRARKGPERSSTLPPQFRAESARIPPDFPISDSVSVSVFDLQRKDPESMAAPEPSPPEPAPAESVARLRVIPPPPPEAPPESPPEPRGGSFGFDASEWAEGVRDVTGERPSLAHRDYGLLEGRGSREAGAAYARFELEDNGGRFGITARRFVNWLVAQRPKPRPKPALAKPPSEPPEPLARVREAFERGIADGTGSPFAWVWTSLDDGALAEVQKKFAVWRTETRPGAKLGEPIRGPDLEAWTEAHAHDFALDVTSRREELRFWSFLGPAGFLRWMNVDRQREEARKHG